MLVIEDLTRQYGDRRAVDGVSLRIEPGSFVGVIGRSGAGKSTLLRLINRLADPSAGRILHDGRDVTGLTGRQLREWRTRCAMIFQQFNLVGRLDVMTNVLMGRLSHVPSHRALLRLWSDADRAMALAALESFDRASSPASGPTACRAASSSAWRSPAPWCRSRRSCWPTSRWPPSTRATPAS